MTWDLDLCVELAAPNLDRLGKVLRRLGFAPRVPAPLEGLADPKTRKVWMEQKQMKVYSFIEQTPRSRVVDIMVKPLLGFAQAYKRRVIVKASGIAVPLAPVDVLVTLKRQAGRPEDLFDLRELKRLGKIADAA
jgi:hypothetical protein